MRKRRSTRLAVCLETLRGGYARNVPLYPTGQ